MKRKRKDQKPATTKIIAAVVCIGIVGVGAGYLLRGSGNERPQPSAPRTSAPQTTPVTPSAPATTPVPAVPAPTPPSPHQAVPATPDLPMPPPAPTRIDRNTPLTEREMDSDKAANCSNSMLGWLALRFPGGKINDAVWQACGEAQRIAFRTGENFYTLLDKAAAERGGRLHVTCPGQLPSGSDEQRYAACTPRNR